MKRNAARHAAETAARTSRGRLIAILAARTRDIAAAEDALSVAFAAALAVWPERGVPQNPDAWLLTVARNAVLNGYRHAKVHDLAMPEITRRASQPGDEPDGFPDARLKLLFVCAHPAIDPAMRTPLMLQTVLGLDAARIGAAFAVPPATMSQRLVRTKSKVRDAGLRFDLPDADAMPDRLSDVLAAVYAAYGSGWDDHASPGSTGLTEEAIYLGRLLAGLMPEAAEAQGLLALMLYCEARRPARSDGAGAFVPLDQQDRGLWSRDMIIEAEGLLTTAARHGRFGRFQCEAAIQSIHVQRAITGLVNHAALLTLYDLLVEHFPGLGAQVGRAAALCAAGQPEAALAALDVLGADRVTSYQPYWATRAQALWALGRAAEAQAAIDRAIALCADPGIRSYLLATRAARGTGN